MMIKSVITGIDALIMRYLKTNKEPLVINWNTRLRYNKRNVLIDVRITEYTDMSMMTVADQELINRAEQMHFRDWDLVDKMIDQAQCDEAKKILRGIRNMYYHREEASIGNI